jgi:LysM repeat protein
MANYENQPSQVEYEPVTGFGISARQLWLIIGLNALISTAISLLVVLVVGPWASTGAVSSLFTSTPQAISQLPGAGPSLDGLVTSTPDVLVTPTFTPVPEPVLYEVQPGDSLSGIALQYDVSLADLMSANGLNDPDTLQAGQTLLIPIGGLVNATPTFTPIVLPTETSIPFDPPTPEGGDLSKPAADVSLNPTETPTVIPTATAPPINEVKISINNVLGYGDVAEEVITLLNEGPGVNLSGWKITGSSLGDYNMPNLFLWNGGSVRIHTKTGTNTPSDLYWGKEEAYWFSGDTVTLLDASGEVVASYAIP